MSKKKSSNIEVKSDGSEEGNGKSTAQTLLSPSVQAAISTDCLDNIYETKYIVSELKEQIESVHNGDMKRAESILIAQAHSLNALSSNMIRKAHSSEYMDSLKTYMNFALKAQNQCRMTLGTLAEIKNPRPYIQNNKAQYQQINNGEKVSHAEGKTETTNELLTDGSNDYETMDIRGASKTGRTDKKMEAVGAKHRSKE